jgi:hypothetical protein
MLDNTIVTSFIVSCIAALVLVLAFFIKAWFNTLNKTLHDLSTNIHEMTQVIGTLREEQKLDKLRIKQLTLEVRSMQATNCTRSDCPNKPTSPGLHTRVEDLITEGV